MTEVDLSLTPLDTLLEEVQKRCLGSVMSLEVSLDGEPENTQLLVCTRGNLSSRLGLAHALMMRVQKDISMEMEEEDDFDDH